MTRSHNEGEQHSRIKGNHNEEGLDSQINRRTRASEENSSRMESELLNMRREMDKLRSALKEKALENLDEMIRRMDSTFTIEVLNCPLQPKFRLPQFKLYDSSKDSLDHIESFKTLMHL